MSPLFEDFLWALALIVPPWVILEAARSTAVTADERPPDSLAGNAPSGQ